MAQDGSTRPRNEFEIYPSGDGAIQFDFPEEVNNNIIPPPKVKVEAREWYPNDKFWGRRAKALEKCLDDAGKQQARKKRGRLKIRKRQE
ncbi:hypothetical protein MMC16_007400 [Acarospora aff. strigata]|nr:hypothetical protein [Acarospora aff. strigata]